MAEAEANTQGLFYGRDAEHRRPHGEDQEKGAQGYRPGYARGFLSHLRNQNQLWAGRSRQSMLEVNIAELTFNSNAVSNRKLVSVAALTSNNLKEVPSWIINSSLEPKITRQIG